MKRVLVVIIVLSSIISFLTGYLQTVEAHYEIMETIEEHIAKPFVIPNDLALSDPEGVYPILFNQAMQSKVNIFRAAINYKVDNQVESSKYILLTRPTRFFDYFTLSSGRLFTIKDTQEGNSFVSSANTRDKNQIGVIKGFGYFGQLTIKPLKASYEFLPVYGRYYLEAPNNETFDAFINGFVTKINKYCKGKASYTATDFLVGNRPLSSNVYHPAVYVHVLKYSNYIIFLLALIIISYYMFTESKKIGILKMNGISNFRLWFILVGKLMVVLFALSSAVSLLLAISLRGATYNFVSSTIMYQFEAYIIMTGISFVSYVYISRIKLSDVIKNRKDTDGIFILNMLLKVGCSILLILTCLTTLAQYDKISHKQQQLLEWEHVKDYGIFYPLTIGYDFNDFQRGGPLVFSAIDGKLYPVLNKMGAVLINAHMYEKASLSLDSSWNGMRSITVNPNYLRQFPIYDIYNNPVEVSEGTSNWVLLVPEEYRNKRKQILNFFQKNRASEMVTQITFYHRAVPQEVKSQQVQIIWLAKYQKVFSFDPDVFPSDNNMITDPIIQVATEGNSLLADRHSILGNGITDPLKIRLINRDTLLTYRTLVPELTKLRLQDNLKHIITPYQFILQEIYGLQRGMKEVLLVIIGLILGMTILVVQNIVIFFNKNQRKFIVRRLFGTGLIRTYKEYFMVLLATWVFQILVCSIATRSVDIKLAGVVLAFMMIEIAVSIVALMWIERRSRVKVLNGGM